MSKARPSQPSFVAPSPQQSLQRATQLAFEALAHQPAEQVRWLGAEPEGETWRLPVLDDTFDVDPSTRRVTTSAGREVSPPWRILALHYLAIAARPQWRTPEITFADLPASRSYAGVYHDRVVTGLCATAGRSAGQLRSAAGTLGGTVVEGGDAAFDFTVFPRLTVRLIWHAPDEEFPPSATLLLPSNIEAYFCIEDIVVLSERLASRLRGRSFY